MSPRHILIHVFLSCCLSLAAQSARQADALFTAGSYSEAYEAYSQLLRKNPTSALYLYRTARCAQQIGDTEQAKELFLRAGNHYPLRDFFLAEIYFDEWLFEEALPLYSSYLQRADTTTEHFRTATTHRSQALTLQRYSRRVAAVELRGVQRVPRSALLEAYPLSAESGTLRLTDTGTEYCTQRGDRCLYSVISTDTTDTANTTTRTLLVSRQRLLDTWEEPDTLLGSLALGQQNTYPFLLQDGATLYFCSDREGGIGGMDIYLTRFNPATGTWLPAENIGMPYNSPYDDFLYAPDEHKGIAYFATNRHCPLSDSVDVYAFVLDTPHYLRDLQGTDLRRHALLSPTLTDSLSETTQPATPAISGNTTLTPDSRTNDSIHFVLDDEHVYDHLSQFNNDSARVLYLTYLSLETEQRQAQQMLDSLRRQYHDADTNTRESLSARIPMLSDEIATRKKTMRETLSQVRALERY